MSGAIPTELKQVLTAKLADSLAGSSPESTPRRLFDAVRLPGKATAVVDMDTLLDNVRKSFGKKFAQKVIDGNLDATRRGYEEVKEG